MAVKISRAERQCQAFSTAAYEDAALKAPFKIHTGKPKQSYKISFKASPLVSVHSQWSTMYGDLLSYLNSS